MSPTTFKEQLLDTLRYWGITRDSMIWNLVAVAAIAGYLVNCPPPDVWTWTDEMKFVAFVSGWLAGKLGNSILRGAQS